MPICISYTGFATVNTTAAVEEYGLRYPGRRIPDRQTDRQTDVCSLVYINICEKKVPFHVQIAMLNVRYSEMWRMMTTLLTWYSEVHALVQEEFLPASVFRA
jgi:hypothetical protein